jgi:hypothetical protein
MKLTKFPILIAFICFCIPFRAQEISKQTNGPKKTTQLPFEKVYLSTDRAYYTSGEDIWFKAYLTDAFTNKLFDNSSCLYVELISSLSAIVQQRAIRLEKGTGIGDFHLGDSIPAGKYQIRAYTSWMRNFGDVFFFKKEIEVVSLLGINNAKTTEKGKIALPENKIDVRFFPEGGSLVEDVYSSVAFKATNTSGNGVRIKAHVLSLAGDTISSFESAHLGMGYFNFIPKKGQKYFVSGSSEEGIPFKVELPSAMATGFCLKVTEPNANYLRISIKTNAQTLIPGEPLLIVCTSHGRLCFSAQTTIKALVNNVVIPKDRFPEGIAAIALFDTTGKPHAERLFYISNNKKLHVSIQADKRVYSPREKITVTVSVKDSSNIPLSANLSLSVTDGNQLKSAEKYASDISSYQWLESDIRGRIEQPAYYFDTTVTERYKHLDLLLLTQGWRDFVWKYLADSSIRIDHLIERGINVTGKLRRLLVNKPIAGANISLGLFGGTKPVMDITQTDSSGNYFFNGLDFTGRRTIIISATNKNHRNQGQISLDSIFGHPVLPNYYFYKTGVNATNISDFKREADRKYSIMKKYRLSDTIALSEVIIQGRKKEKNTDDGHFRMYGTPDNVIEVTDQYAGYSDIFQLLQGRVAGLMISGSYPNISFSMRGSRGEPTFLLDGMQTDIDMIANIPISDIDKIEVLKSAGNLAMFGSQGANGVISVFTKRGFVSGVKPVFHSINQVLYGFYQARTFYAPNYDVKTPDHEKPDLRTTIHWEPNIITDANGNATVSFFNADNITTIKINAEGLTGSGIPVVLKTSYQVR